MQGPRETTVRSVKKISHYPERSVVLRSESAGLPRLRRRGSTGTGELDPASRSGRRATGTWRWTLAVVILPMVTSGSCSGPRWRMALAVCSAAETLGAFDAGIG